MLEGHQALEEQETSGLNFWLKHGMYLTVQYRDVVLYCGPMGPRIFE